jgi:hypothetical protein
MARTKHGPEGPQTAIQARKKHAARVKKRILHVSQSHKAKIPRKVAQTQWTITEAASPRSLQMAAPHGTMPGQTGTQANETGYFAQQPVAQQITLAEPVKTSQHTGYRPFKFTTLFNKSTPKLFFELLEDQFDIQGITDDHRQMIEAFQALGAEASWFNYIMEDKPANDKYRTLKQAVMTKFELTAQQKFEKITSETMKITQKPTDYLRVLRSLAKGHLSEVMITSRWLAGIPEDIKKAVGVFQTEISLDEMAKRADVFADLPKSDLTQQALVNVVTQETKTQDIAMKEGATEKTQESVPEVAAMKFQEQRYINQRDRPTHRFNTLDERGSNARPFGSRGYGGRGNGGRGYDNRGYRGRPFGGRGSGDRWYTNSSFRGRENRDHKHELHQNNATQPKLCSYHNTYGNEARKCSGPPCPLASVALNAQDGL